MKRISFIILSLFLTSVPFVSKASPESFVMLSPTSCGSVVLYQNGTPSQVLCKNGYPNAGAKKFLLEISPRVMALTAYSSQVAINKAICSDLAKGSIQGAIDAYTYIYALNNWKDKRTSIVALSNALVNNPKFCH